MDIFRTIRIRPFLLMLTSQFFSNLAFNMQHFVLILLVFGLTRSNTAVSGVILSFTIPAVLFSLISGVHVDRWDKRKILFSTNIIRGILILLFLVHNLHVGFMYIITFLIAIATQFFIPAGSAVVPILVPQRLIMSANSILYLGVYATMFLGYILAGFFLLFLGKGLTITFLALLFFTSAFLILHIKPGYGFQKPKKLKGAGTSFLMELHEILPFIKKTKKVIQALVVLTIAQAIIFMFAVLGPGYVATILNIEVERLSLILIAPAALGMVIGALLLGSIGKHFKFKWLSGVGFMLSGVIFFLFSHGERVAVLPVVIILSVLVGFAISLIFIPGHSTLQTETSERLRGRIYGLLNALTGVVSFLPVVLAGGFADIFGVGTVVSGVGFIMLIISIFFFVFA